MYAESRNKSNCRDGDFRINRIVRPLDSLVFQRNCFLSGGFGQLVLLITGLLQQMTVSASDLKRNFRPLLFTGVALGLNWVFLFEAYKHTTMANATISYLHGSGAGDVRGPDNLARETDSAENSVCGSGIAWSDDHDAECRATLCRNRYLNGLAFM